MDSCTRHEVYVSPFSARYISKEISYLFSAQFKISTFRRLWIALAKAQQKLGLPITNHQISQMESQITNIDFIKAEELPGVNANHCGKFLDKQIGPAKVF